MSLWNDCPITGTRPNARGGHASALVSLGDNRTGLVVVGGSDAFGMTYNDVFVMEEPITITGAAESSAVTSSTAAGGANQPKKLHCTQLQASSSSTHSFSPRMGHSAQAVSKALASKMAEAAGSFANAAAVCEVDDKDDVSKKDSEEEVKKDAPTTATTTAKRPKRLSDPIVIFGGMCTAPETLHNTVWLLRIDIDYKERLEEDAKRKIRTNSSLGPLVSWEELSGCTGAVPPARHAHASALVGDELLIVGGSDDTHPLEDAYALNLVTRVWRRVDTAVASSTVSTTSSSASSLPGREMASMAAHPLSGHVLLSGGRDCDGLMLGDAYALGASSTSNNAPAASSITCAMADDNQRRCCHTLIPSVHPKLGPIFLAVGGFTPAGMPQEDVVLAIKEADASSGSGKGGVVAKPIAVPRRLQRKQSEDLHFGLGHSAAYGLSACGSSVAVYAVTGIMPNAVAATMAVYELVVADEGSASGAPAAAEASATAPSNAATAIAGLL